MGGIISVGFCIQKPNQSVLFSLPHGCWSLMCFAILLVYTCTYVLLHLFNINVNQIPFLIIFYIKDLVEKVIWNTSKHENLWKLGQWSDEAKGCVKFIVNLKAKHFKHGSIYHTYEINISKQKSLITKWHDTPQQTATQFLNLT